MPTDEYDDEDRPRRPRSSRDDDEDRPARRPRRDDDEYDAPRGAGGGLKAHRGTMILIFGILALVQCCAIVFGLLAIIMGQSDLKEMDAGRMDPSGRGMTQTGVILGIVGLILFVILTILRFTVFAGRAVIQQ